MVKMVYDGRRVSFGVGCLYYIAIFLLLLTYTLANYSMCVKI
jgi:hypothetical protein